MATYVQRIKSMSSHSLLNNLFNYRSPTLIIQNKLCQKSEGQMNAWCRKREVRISETGLLGPYEGHASQSAFTVAVFRFPISLLLRLFLVLNVGYALPHPVYPFQLIGFVGYYTRVSSLNPFARFYYNR